LPKTLSCDMLRGIVSRQTRSLNDDQDITKDLKAS